jgi:peptidoglycan/LPS O-acetylase OafA/YrhL
LWPRGAVCTFRPHFRELFAQHFRETAKRGRRSNEGNEVGTVRFLLALCVVVTHVKGSSIFGLTLLSGLTAVQCFYVISGFLITMVLNERADYAQVSNFYLSRYLRLWPAYIVVALASLLLTRRDWFSQLAQLVHWDDVAFLALSNLTLFLQDWTLFLRFDAGHLVPTDAFGTWPGPQVNSFLLVPQCWSIGVELTFYLIAPFVCRKVSTLVALLGFGVVTRLIMGALHPPALDPWLYRFAPAEMMLFAAGGLAYFGGQLVYAHRPRLARRACALSVALFVALVFGSELVTPWITKFGGLSRPLLLLNWPLLLLMILTVAPLFFGARSHRLDHALGELSYPLYLCHILVGTLIATWLPERWQAGNGLYVAAVIVVAIALDMAVIKPVDLFRRRLGARTAADLPAAPSAAELAAERSEELSPELSPELLAEPASPAPAVLLLSPTKLRTNLS